jgi:hypothetical protein
MYILALRWPSFHGVPIVMRCSWFCVGRGRRKGGVGERRRGERARGRGRERVEASPHLKSRGEWRDKDVKGIRRGASNRAYL